MPIPQKQPTQLNGIKEHVEAIIELSKSSCNPTKYLVKWKDRPLQAATWEPDYIFHFTEEQLADKFKLGKEFRDRSKIRESNNYMLQIDQKNSDQDEPQGGEQKQSQLETLRVVRAYIDEYKQLYELSDGTVLSKIDLSNVDLVLDYFYLQLMENCPQ